MGPLFWLVLVWVLLLAAVAALTALASQYRVEPTTTLSGTLVRQTALQDIVLPAGMPVEDILVQNGDQISKGQAVLLYDTDQLHKRLTMIEASLSENALDQDCLRTPIEQKVSKTPAAVLHEGVQADPIASACQLRMSEAAIARQEIEQRIRTLHLSQLQRRMHNDDDVQAASRQDQIARELSQNVDIHALQIDIQRQSLMLRKLIAKQDEERKEALDNLIEVHRKEQALAGVLRQALEDPFLRAPAAGRLIRLRPLPQKATPTTDTPIAQLLMPGAGYYATAQMPDRALNALQAGDHATLRLSGLPLTAPTIPARIEKIIAEQGQLDVTQPHAVQIELHPEDISDEHWRRRIMRHLELMNGQARVTVRLQPLPLWLHLRRSALRLLPSQQIETNPTR